MSRYTMPRVLGVTIIDSGGVHQVEVEVRVYGKVYQTTVELLAEELARWRWPNERMYPDGLLYNKAIDQLRTVLYDERPRARLGTGSHRHRRWKGAVR